MKTGIIYGKENGLLGIRKNLEKIYWRGKLRNYIIFCDNYEEMTTALEKTDRGTFDRNRAFAGEFLWKKQLDRILEEST